MLLFVKLSLLLLYKEINPNRRFGLAVYLVMTICVIQTIGTIAGLIFKCWPIKLSWDPRVPGQCVDARLFYWTITGVNVGTDVLVFVLPIPMIWPVQMTFRQKATLIVMFAVGLL